MPSPVLYARECGLKSPGYVCDPSGVLSEEARENIATLLDAIERGVHDDACASGSFQVAVAISKRANQGSRRFASGDDAVEEAKRLMDDWGVGIKGCNNGVVLFLAMDDRKFGLYAGAGASEYLPSYRRNNVLEGMKDDLRAGRVDRAVTNAVLDIRNALQTKPSKIAAFFQKLLEFAFWLVMLTVFVVVCVIVTKHCNDERRRKRRAGEVRQRLRLIDDADTSAKAAADDARSKASTFADKRCPVCFDDFSDIPNPVVLPCGHKMCDTCARSWFGSSNLCTKAGMSVCISKTPHHKCPVCRQSALATDAHIGIVDKDGGDVDGATRFRRSPGDRTTTAAFEDVPLLSRSSPSTYSSSNACTTNNTFTSVDALRTTTKRTSVAARLLRRLRRLEAGDDDESSALTPPPPPSGSSSEIDPDILAASAEAASAAAAEQDASQDLDEAGEDLNEATEAVDEKVQEVDLEGNRESVSEATDALAEASDAAEEAEDD
eukprot:g4025.t1